MVRVLVSGFNVSFWIVIGLSEALANAHAKALAKMHPTCACVRGWLVLVSWQRVLNMLPVTSKVMVLSWIRT